MAASIGISPAVASPARHRTDLLSGENIFPSSPKITIPFVSYPIARHGTRILALRCRSRQEHCQVKVNFRRKHQRWTRAQASAGGAAAGVTGGDGGAIDAGDNAVLQTDKELANGPVAESSNQEKGGVVRDAKAWWQNWQASAVELRAKVAKLGLSAVLAYGLFDGVTYTTFFVLAFLGYEKSTGSNPAANLKSLLGIVVLMWTGNNFTRPFRVAGAAALAPFIDRGLRRLQELLKLPNLAFTFMLVVATFASLCFSVVGLLILSRLGKA